MMMIERRCTERIDMDWHVTIIVPRMGISHGRARNVCDHGLFILKTAVNPQFVIPA